MLPFSFLLWRENLYLGRLSVIKEARGKARVIGITDNWTQLLLKPLHDAVYQHLDTLDEDGTRDQIRPVEILLSKVEPTDSQNLVSVDLSAATDRLPVRLQADILNLLGFPGDNWMKILSRPYYYEGNSYVYSVGQPMGAYSSFAMLALSNHVLCHAACLSNGMDHVMGQGHYAVLGDDVAHRHPNVAETYTSYLRKLGVEVNPIKGFNGDVIEFAKRVFFRNGIEISPLGAKSLVRATRIPSYLASVLKDA